MVRAEFQIFLKKNGGRVDEDFGDLLPAQSWGRRSCRGQRFRERRAARAGKIGRPPKPEVSGEPGKKVIDLSNGP
jgi:hypothetical protein